MFSNVTTPTPYYPFDCLPPVKSLALSTLLNGQTVGAMPGPFLTAEQAFELRYNVKGMLISVPQYEYTDFDNNIYLSAAGNLIMNRYTVATSNINNIRFASQGSLGGEALTFFIDFSLGSTWIPTPVYILSNTAYFAPVTKFYGQVVTTSGGSFNLLAGAGGSFINFSYWGSGDIYSGGFLSQDMGSVFIPVGMTSMAGNGDGNSPVFENSNQLTTGGIVCTERIEDIYFSPSQINHSVANTITITCPPTQFAVAQQFDNATSRTGFSGVTQVTLAGLNTPILLAGSKGSFIGSPTFTLSASSKAKGAVVDTITIKLPANTGVQTGRIGITSIYNANDASNSTDYFEPYIPLYVT